MHTFVVTGALITPTTRNNTAPFNQEVEANFRDDAVARVYEELSQGLNPDGEGEGDVFNFYVINVDGTRWYGWEPEDEDDLGWGQR